MMNDEVTNILLIEDTVGDAVLVKEMIQRTTDFKINLLVADNLARGLKYIAAENLHAILLDLNLPDSRGLKTFQQVHKFSMNTPVVIMSILTDKELIYQAMKEGAQDYLIKNQLEKEAFVRCIRYAIWSRHAA